MQNGVAERKRKATTRGGLIKTSLQFSPGLIEEMDRIAAERGLSRSAVASELLRSGLQNYRDSKKVPA